MTTGTIIFIVVLVVQAIIRMAVKQAEKKANAAKAAQVALPVTTQAAPPAEIQSVSNDALQRSSGGANDDEEDEEDPEGEATSAYLRERMEQIHASALGGRHPKPVATPALIVAKSVEVDRAQSGGVRSTLATKAGLRQGFVLAEVLGPPVSLRKSI